MKKKILIVFLSLIAFIVTGCQSVVARRDQSQIVEFNNGLSRGEYILKAYKLDYPKTVEEKDLFFDNLNVLMGKMIAHKKDLNIIIPYELYQDIRNIGIREVRESEKVFFKPASDLTQEEKDYIDSKIKIDFPTNAGTIQQYLNKQVYYWFDYLKRSGEYDEYAYYTELDKMRIVSEVFDKRKLTSKMFYPIAKDFILEVDEKNIVEAGAEGFPIYTKDTFGKENDIKANIIILETGGEPRIIPNKILLVEGTDVDTVKDYRFGVKVEEIKDPKSLLSKFEDEEDIKIKDMLRFKVVTPEKRDNRKASVKVDDIPRDILNIKEEGNQWRIN